MLRRGSGAVERLDILASPTLAAPPLSAEQDAHGPVMIGGREAGRIRGAWYPYTYPFNLTGHPALTVPAGTTASGLPLALQLVGPWYAEALLFNLGGQINGEASAFS